MDKENYNHIHSPLREKNHFHKNHPHKEQLKFDKNDPILLAIQEQINSKSSSHIYDLMLSDPLLQELNKSLQKQAEQQKKHKLLQTFPLRFKSLVQTQQLYKKLKNNFAELQKQIKQTIQSSCSQKQQLISQLNQLREEITEKNEIIINLQQSAQAQKQQISENYLKKIEEKDKIINQIERKLIKSKTQRENLIEYLEEIKEQAELLKRQNQRIIKTITQKQEQISHLSKTINQKQFSYKTSKQKFIQELTASNINFQEKFASKTKQCNQMVNIIQGYKIRMNQYQNKLIQICAQQQQQDNERFNEIQEVRMKLLQQIKQKNNLQQKFQELKQQSINEIQNYKNQIEVLQQEISNLNIIIGQNNLNHEIEIHNVKDNMKKIQNSKDQIIEQAKQNIHLLTEEKLFLQTKVLKLEGQKQALVSNLQKQKVEIDIYSKKIVDTASKQNKNDDKNKQIQKMLNSLKGQLSKYNQIINQKEQKIQQYRKQILSLRNKIKENYAEKQNFKIEIYEKDNAYKKQKQQKQETHNNLLKARERQNILSIKIEHYQKMANRQKSNQQTQFQIIENFNDEEQIIKANLIKQLQKSKSKYQNILEELQQYKKQFNKISIHAIQEEQSLHKTINPYQNTIKQLQEQNLSMKQLISTKLYQPSEIQNLLDTKILDLKTYYESKIQEEGKKYRVVIQMLKGEVTQLYKQMDLKRSMEEQMYNEIVQINVVRNAKKNQLLE